MFEEIIKSQADRDREELEHLTPRDIRARRLAAGILVAHVIVGIAIDAASGKSGFPFLSVALSLVPAYFLFRLHPRAVPLAQAFAVLAAIVGPLAAYLEMQRKMNWGGILEIQQEIALCECLRIWGVAGAILLLLADGAGRRRQLLAVLLLVVPSAGHVLTLFNTRRPPEPVVSDLQYFRSITLGIRRAETLKLYAGLPHQMFARDLYESELATKKTVQLHGYPFYERPLTVRAEDIERLRRVSAAPESYRTYAPSPCGGFHPDYALVWEGGGQTYGVLVCYGCQEALLYGPEQELMVELAGPFGAILNDYDSQGS